MSMRAPPSETLDPRARTVWRLTAVLWSVAALAAALAIAALLAARDLPPPVVFLPVVVWAIGAVAAVVVVPDLLFRHWRYQLGEEEIDLQHGMLTITRTLIPMARIQHVDTRRGLLERRFGLASVVLYTAAGASAIPGLAGETADRLRDRIAALASTRDDL